MALEGQSGIPSAMGRCIESLWRTAPITVVSGAENSLGIAATNPLRFKVIDGGGIDPDLDIMEPIDEIDGYVELGRTILGAKAYPGSVAYKGDGENLYDTLLAIFGRDVQTQVAGATSTSITPVYKHVFTPAVYAPSWAFEEQFGDRNNGRVTTGVLTNSVELDFGRVLTVREGLVGYRQIPNLYPNGSGVDTQYDFTSSTSLIPVQLGGDGTKTWKRTVTPTYVDVAQLNNGNGPFVFGGLTFGNESGFSAAFIKIDDVAYSAAKLLEGMNISVARRIDSFQVGGAVYDPGACVGNSVRVGGNLSLLYADNTLAKALTKFSKISLNFIINGIYIGSSAVKYSIEVYIPNAKFRQAPTSIGSGAIMTGGAFVAQRDPTLGYSIKVSLVNTFTNASLAGAAGSTGAAGGLGGWLNA
jgi:hypothetical protein